MLTNGKKDTACCATLWYWSVKWKNKTLLAAVLCDTEVWSEQKRHRMLGYFVILKCEVTNKDTACCATLWYWSVNWLKKTPLDTEVLIAGTKDTACCATLWYWSVMLKKRTPHAAVLCDTEVWSKQKRHRMLRCFVILKYGVKKRHCMLGYFVILKCDVVKNGHRLILKC